MNHKAKIYVAGHAGMVGSALMRLLVAEGYQEIVTKNFYELDLRIQGDVDRFFAYERPEYVFLAAAKVGGIVANSTYKAEFIYDNIIIATNLIHAAKRYGVKKLLNFGSSCIYPKLAPQPLKEEYLLTGPLEPTNEPYALAKIAAIKLCRFYNEQYGTNFISVMPTNLYGSHDNFNLHTAHVVPALIRKFHLAALLQRGDFAAIKNDLYCFGIGLGFDGKMGLYQADDATLQEILTQLGITRNAVTLWGSGKPLREFLYVDDLARAALFLMQRSDYTAIGECINIGAGVDQTIDDVAHMIKKIVGFHGDITYDATKPDGTPRKVLDVSRITALGWSASTPLNDGIKQVYEWYCAQQVGITCAQEKGYVNHGA